MYQSARNEFIQQAREEQKYSEYPDEYSTAKAQYEARAESYVGKKRNSACV